MPKAARIAISSTVGFVAAGATGGVGQSISKWEPRTLYLNEQKPEIYLVRQMGDGFEYRGTNGAVYNTSAVGLKAYMSAPEYADQVNSAIRKPMA